MKSQDFRPSGSDAEHPRSDNFLWDLTDLCWKLSEYVGCDFSPGRVPELPGPTTYCRPTTLSWPQCFPR
jgi:hypothetical protein